MENRTLCPYDESVQPNRFVTHVTCGSNRQNILKKGLLKAKALLGVESSVGVFVHNSIVPDLNWYPFIMDVWENHNGINYSLFHKYDFWVIDTLKLDQKWYHDTLAYQDFGIRHLYLMTNESIPLEAITLYSFQTEVSWEVVRNGSLHFRSLPRFREVKL